MDEVSRYIFEQSKDRQPILLFFHEKLLEYPGVYAKISYQIPFYHKKSWICYLNTNKKSGIDLSFVRGHELSNAQNLLESRQRKMVRSIHLEKLQDIQWEPIQEIIQEALWLDEKVPYTGPLKAFSRKKQ